MKHIAISRVIGKMAQVDWVTDMASGIEKIDFSSNKQQALDALKKAKEVIGDTPIEIDYTLTLRPASLARLLLENGFNVVSIYEDCFAGEEEEEAKGKE